MKKKGGEREEEKWRKRIPRHAERRNAEKAKSDTDNAETKPTPTTPKSRNQ